MSYDDDDDRPRPVTIPANPGFNVLKLYSDDVATEPVIAWRVAPGVAPVLNVAKVEAFTAPFGYYDVGAGDDDADDNDGRVIGLQYPDGRVFIGGTYCETYGSLEEARRHLFPPKGAA